MIRSLPWRLGLGHWGSASAIQSDENFADGVRGYLFQGQFGSCVLGETHLFAAARALGPGLSLATVSLRAQQGIRPSEKEI